MPRYRKKPLSQLEHGTRIVRCRSEDAARSKARELEQFIAQAAQIRDAYDAGPRSVERLAARYIEDHLSGLSVHCQVFRR